MVRMAIQDDGSPQDDNLSLVFQVTSDAIRALLVKGAPLRRQAKAGLSKLSLVVASRSKQATAVKTGLQVGGDDHGTLTELAFVDRFSQQSVEVS